MNDFFVFKSIKNGSGSFVSAVGSDSLELEIIQKKGFARTLAKPLMELSNLRKEGKVFNNSIRGAIFIYDGIA